MDRAVPDKNYEAMMRKAPAFLTKCKLQLPKINEKKIKAIRAALKEDG